MIPRRRLDRGLDELGATALAVVARSSRDADLAPFVGPIHLGDGFLVLPREGEPRLAYLTAMEREEAALSGLELLTPESLEVRRLAADLPTEEAVIAALLERALAASGVGPGRVALAGSGRSGVLLGIAKSLEARGFTLLPGNRLALELRKPKGAREVEAARRAAAG
ncbi:MAG TPA: hypothetical protein PK413_10490, partial [Thermoanaerobaculia bacterium]|nr:hypothetical protein [Thermoanaerobaculia bacterium]